MREKEAFVKHSACYSGGMPIPFSFLGLLVTLTFLLTFVRWFAGVRGGAPYVLARLDDIRWAFDEVSLSANDTVLDLGCGSGGILLEAAKRGARHRLRISSSVGVVRWIVDCADMQRRRWCIAAICSRLMPVCFYYYDFWHWFDAREDSYSP